MHSAPAYGGYGAAQMYPEHGAMYGAGMAKQPFRRRPTNPITLVACLFIPVVIFTVVYSMQSFAFHYNSPSTCRTLCLLLLVGVISVAGSTAALAWRRREDGMTDPKWYTFLLVTSVVAWVLAYVLGDRNFSVNISPYMDIMNLNVYHDVDPEKYNGQQMMDAGRIVFAQGTHLALPLSMGFKNLDTYCVAPVASATPSNATGPQTYDFWAVGLNCCSGHVPDFHCGDFQNPKARSGLRLMRDDQRAYFRLAVEQAEAAYNIRAPHPLFLYWMQDPMAEVGAYQNEGYKFWIIGVSTFAGFQLVLEVLAIIAFWKAGI
mmetsp:Transcript_107368/g.300690  ORF Transcript_107368/g.300690 Transcript_107368/m.300690 type:complete len:318 (-) Transcript_107368:46-999(-)